MEYEFVEIVVGFVEAAAGLVGMEYEFVEIVVGFVEAAVGFVEMESDFVVMIVNRSEMVELAGEIVDIETDFAFLTNSCFLYVPVDDNNDMYNFLLFF